jgi:protein O-mannosyl-transferase
MKFNSKQKKILRGNVKFEDFLNNSWIVLGILGFLIFTAYVNSLGNEFVSDDIPTIVNSPIIGYFYNPNSSNPLMGLVGTVIHAGIYHMFGMDPWAFRLSNILFHFGSASLIFLIVKKLKSSRLGFITACVFAVHPVLTESVTWISGAPYAEYGFLMLASFYYYLKISKKKIFYWLAVIFFLISLMVNEKGIVFPLILLTYELVFGSIKENFKKLTPFFILSGLWFLFLVGVLGTRIETLTMTHSQTGGFYNPLVQIPIAITTYIQLIFLPLGLTLYHSELLLGNLEYFVRVLGLLTFFVALFWSYKKDRWVFFWLGFFLISLLPMLTPLKVASVVAERYVYFGSIGIITIFSYYLDKLASSERWREVSFVLFLFILILLLVRTMVRNIDWRTQDSLWMATAKTSPSSNNNHNNLGDMYARKGEYEKATEEFLKAIELQPNYADAYHNLANTYMKMNKDEEAEVNFRKALDLNPKLWQSHKELAILYYKQGEIDKTRLELEAALKIDSSQIEIKKALEELN